MKQLLTLFLLLSCALVSAQELTSLTVKKIMRDPQWMGSQPKQLRWSEDGSTLYFKWNPDNNPADSLYKISLSQQKPKKVTAAERKNLQKRYRYNVARTKATYSFEGDIYYVDLSNNQTIRLTQTVEREFNPNIAADDKKVYFRKGDNLFSWAIASGQLAQHTNMVQGDKKKAQTHNKEDWVRKEELELIEVLNERNEKREARNNNNTNKTVPPVYFGKGRLTGLGITANHRFVTYRTYARSKNKSTIVPDFVNKTAYTKDLNARPKVGVKPDHVNLGIYDNKKDSSYYVDLSELPGIEKYPEYYTDAQKTGDRPVYIHSLHWSPDQANAAFVVRSFDNKDRWICMLDFANGKPIVLDHQRDEAWIAGPGIGWSSWDNFINWTPDGKAVWFQSEATGYSHLYTVNIETKKKKALTSGKYEVYNVTLSGDKKSWYFQANDEHPGIRHFYKMPLKGGKKQRLTSKLGNWNGTPAPNGTAIAYLYSNANTPWELYLASNEKTPEKITSSASKEFQSYPWRQPEFITFKAEDGANVHARLYKGKNGTENKPAVIFVHGAGYLQNAHQWWSSYFREYMFHNLLADLGYTVLDIDYRGSAGYGRDWRTGIYRHMGGLDLSDQVDGSKYLTEVLKIDPSRIGIYGGSYGGFITLMAMFNASDKFAAGAALRSVTDWAHYNHGYTANILNTPQEDPEAYKRSSPIYFAEGLKGPLLICHGMVDTNVQFQDVVRLSQRLIELEKENWEMAVYPMEGHGFVEPSSWTDEYSRILKLFETHLK